MRPTVPNSGTVDAAFRALEKRLTPVRKKINSQAAQRMRCGDYDLAQKWMDVGSSVIDFAERTNAFKQEWKQLTRAVRIANSVKEETTAKTTIKARSSNTPAWKFCTPALEVTASRGGIASHDDVVQDLEKSMALELTKKDRESKPPQSMPLWHVTVRKAYRQCQREGWIEKRAGGVWKITPKGRGVLAQSERQDGSGVGQRVE